MVVIRAARYKLCGVRIAIYARLKYTEIMFYPKIQKQALAVCQGLRESHNQSSSATSVNITESELVFSAVSNLTTDTEPLDSVIT